MVPYRAIVFQTIFPVAPTRVLRCRQYARMHLPDGRGAMGAKRACGVAPSRQGAPPHLILGTTQADRQPGSPNHPPHGAVAFRAAEIPKADRNHSRGTAGSLRFLR